MTQKNQEQIIAVCVDCGKELTQRTLYTVKTSDTHNIACCFHCANNREEIRDFPNGLPMDQHDIEYEEYIHEHY